MIDGMRQRQQDSTERDIAKAEKVLAARRELTTRGAHARTEIRNLTDSVVRDARNHGIIIER